MNTMTQEEVREAFVASKPGGTRTADSKECIKKAWQLCTSEPWPFIGEHKFHEKRKWRFDWAVVDLKLAIELEGVVWKPGQKGRHQTAQGLAGDCEKYNTAIECGWVVLRLTPGMVSKAPGIIVDQILAVADLCRKRKESQMIRPINDQVVIRRAVAESKTPGGIFIPEAAKPMPMTGTVVAIGPGLLITGSEARAPMQVKVGDEIIFAQTQFGFMDIEVDGQPLVVMPEKNIIGILYPPAPTDAAE